jgi:hypothetical protein
MDLPLLLSGFSGLLTAFLVGAVWATRRPNDKLTSGEPEAVALKLPAHRLDQRS